MIIIDIIIRPPVEQYSVVSTTGVVNTQGARWSSGLKRLTGDWVVLGSNTALATSLWNFGNSVYPALPVSFGGDTSTSSTLYSAPSYSRITRREKLKAVGPFYLVSMPGEVKYPTSLHWKCVTGN